MSICLIGYRGTGKTTVAALLAQRLGRAWLDADVELERRAGSTIAEIFARHGEHAFRNLESEVLVDLLQGEPRVLALGGGVVLREANRLSLQRAEAVVWLQARPETLWQRIAADPSTSARRPNLTAGGGITEITQLLAERTPLYSQCATLAVDTEGKSPDEIVGEILPALGPAASSRNRV